MDPKEGRSDLLYTFFTFFSRPTVIRPRKKTMEKIQVMLPDELIQYLKGLVADPENPLQSVSGAIRWIISKEMKKP